MAKTGNVAVIETGADAVHDARRAPAGLLRQLLTGMSVIAFLAALALPVTVDSTSLAPVLSSALAGNGNGNGDGQGKGNGNGKGRGDENGGGNSPGDDDDGDDEDQPTGGSGEESNDRDPADYGDIDDMAFSDAIADVSIRPNEAPTNPAASGLPTIREIFQLGEDSVLNSEQELLAIENGWSIQN